MSRLGMSALAIKVGSSDLIHPTVHKVSFYMLPNLVFVGAWSFSSHLNLNRERNLFPAMNPKQPRQEK